MGLQGISGIASLFYLENITLLVLISVFSCIAVSVGWFYIWLCGDKDSLHHDKHEIMGFIPSVIYLICILWVFSSFFLYYTLSNDLNYVFQTNSFLISDLKTNSIITGIGPFLIVLKFMVNFWLSEKNQNKFY